jgi:hypothetical protein
MPPPTRYNALSGAFLGIFSFFRKNAFIFAL